MNIEITNIDTDDLILSVSNTDSVPFSIGEKISISKATKTKLTTDITYKEYIIVTIEYFYNVMHGDKNTEIDLTVSVNVAPVFKETIQY